VRGQQAPVLGAILEALVGGESKGSGRHALAEELLDPRELVLARGEYGTSDATFTPSRWLWARLSRYWGKVSQSQRIPARIERMGIASIRHISAIASSRSAGRVGAKPKPH
jgi:hypothetical protein